MALKEKAPTPLPQLCPSNILWLHFPTSMPVSLPSICFYLFAFFFPIYLYMCALWLNDKSVVPLPFICLWHFYLYYTLCACTCVCCIYFFPFAHTHSPTPFVFYCVIWKEGICLRGATTVAFYSTVLTAFDMAADFAHCLYHPDLSAAHSVSCRRVPLFWCHSRTHACYIFYALSPRVVLRFTAFSLLRSFACLLPFTNTVLHSYHHAGTFAVYILHAVASFVVPLQDIRTLLETARLLMPV